jgi:hypothetical protein
MGLFLDRGTARIGVSKGPAIFNAVVSELDVKGVGRGASSACTGSIVGRRFCVLE